MMKHLTTSVCIFSLLFLFVSGNGILKAQSNLRGETGATSQAIAGQRYQLLKPLFDAAYTSFPQIPAGMLEAVSYTNTHFVNLSNAEESCTGMPASYGIMGLTLNGKNYFRNNLLTISSLSGIAAEEIMSNPASCIMAYAGAFARIKERLDIVNMRCEDQLPVLRALSELPENGGTVNDFATDSWLYSVYLFYQSNEYRDCGLTPVSINMEELFGKELLQLLQSPRILISDSSVFTPDGKKFTGKNTAKDLKSTDYPPALWVPACSSNYSSRGGTAISAITLHTVQGSYSGCISWFQNCSAQVSAHYVLRSSDGQITQMVADANKAWHVGTENPYTIGYEHEGYVTDSTWYTAAMYTASADLTKHICNEYGIDTKRCFWGPASSGSYVVNCPKIKGHQNYPNQTHTDPGINWKWDYYYKLVNSARTPVTYTTTTGNLYDSGGSGGDYGLNEGSLWLIQPANTSSVTLSFSSFSTEANWDYMYIYNGSTVFSPLIGIYTGTSSPGTVTANSGSMLIEFRSDCNTNSSGWAAAWTSQQIDIIDPVTVINNSTIWATGDFSVSFTDTDNPGGSGVSKKYYQVMEYTGSEWRANESLGFFNDNFNTAIHTSWVIPAGGGTWGPYSGTLRQTDQAVTNSNIYTPLTQNSSNEYLFQWSARMDGSGSNRRSGLHFFVNNPALPNRGLSYLAWFRVDDGKVQLYRISGDTLYMKVNNPLTLSAGVWYEYKVTYSPSTGLLKAYLNDALVASWTDPNPITAGNYISLRSGDCDVQYDDVKVRVARGNSATINVGSSGSDQVRYQSPHPLQEACRINTIIVDGAGNWSAPVVSNTLVDWTKPASIAQVNDGSAGDADTTHVQGILSANWRSSSDTNSGIMRYEYAAGTQPGDSNIINWTGNATDTSMSVSGQTLTDGTIYYFSVRAINNAGIKGDAVISDGQRYVDITGFEPHDYSYAFILRPNPAREKMSIVFFADDDAGFTLEVFDMNAKRSVLRKECTAQKGWNNVETDISGLSQGFYTVRLISGKQVTTKKLIID